jgi:hypothetical protein
MRKGDIIDFENKFLGGGVSNKNQDNDEKEITKFSEEWKYVDFLLKSSVSTDASIQRLLAINNQNMKIKFDKLSEGKTTINAWININQLGDINYMKKIKLNGFDIPPTGLDFWTGSVVDEIQEEQYQENDNIYILCKIVVGRTYIKIIKNKTEINNIDNVKALKPPEYDSVLFWSKENSEKSTQFTPLKCYRYRIFDTESVLPLYYVFFNMKDLNNQISAIRICDECNQLPACFYCVDCDAELCEDDFNSIHSPDNKQLFNFHTKVKIEKNRPGICDCENKNPVEYYCNECNKSICSYCKILGSHSKGLALEHQLEEIDVVWRSKSPETNEIFAEAEAVRKNRAYEFLSKISKSTELMRYNVLSEARKELDNEFKKEFIYSHDKSRQLISEDVQVINQLIILKSLVTWISEYFYERENFFKENKNNREVIWIWGFHLQFVNDHMSNVVKISNEYVDLRHVSFENKSLNKFSIIKLFLDDDFSENVDDSKTAKRINRMSIVNNKVIVVVGGLQEIISEKQDFKPSSALKVKNLKGRPSLENSNNKSIVKLIGEILIKKDLDKSNQND